MGLLALEEFEVPLTGGAARPREMVPATMVEAERAAGFEQGYQAGWDDAARANAEDQTRIGSEFARNLQELSFTFHEARAHVTRAIEPFLTELTGTLLPALVTETLGQRILEELRPLIADAADTPVELLVSPASRPALEPLMNENTSAVIQLVEEPSLAEGQVYLRLGHNERQIDLSGALAATTEAIRALYAVNERTLKHG